MRPASGIKRLAGNVLSVAGVAVLAGGCVLAFKAVELAITGSPSRSQVTACAKIVADDLRISAQTAEYMRAAADGLQPKDFLTTLCDGKPNCNNHK